MLYVASLKEYPEYLQEIARWHYDEWSAFYPQNRFEDFLSDLERSLEDDFIPSSWVLLDDKKAVGSASILDEDMTTNTHLFPWLANIFILPEYRRKGYGYYLVSKVLEIAREQALPVLYLFTADQSEFYKKLGWKILKKERYHQEDVTIMVLHLESKE